jgi:hypothetical protein
MQKHRYGDCASAMVTEFHRWGNLLPSLRQKISIAEAQSQESNFGNSNQ